MTGSVVDTFYKTEPVAARSVPVDLSNVLKMLQKSREVAAYQMSSHEEAMRSHMQSAEECRQYAADTQQRIDELNEAIAILGAAAGSTD